MMNRSDSERLFFIDCLKAMAIILVVLGHSISYYEEIDEIDNIVYVLKTMIYSVHVRLFFVISGYLCHSQEKRTYFQKKIRRILLQFYMFSILKLIYINGVVFEYIYIKTYVKNILEVLLYGRTYWFSYCLFVIFLIAPIFWEMNSKKIAICCGFLIIVNLIISTYQIELTDLFQISSAIYYITFFLIGMFINKENIFKEGDVLFGKKKGILVMAIGITVILISLKMMGINSVILSYLLASSLMVILYYIAIEIQNKKIMKVVSIVSKYSYQIMLFDSLFKVVLFKVFCTLFDASQVWIFIITVVNIVLSCVCCEVAKKIPLINLAFGLK